MAYAQRVVVIAEGLKEQVALRFFILEYLTVRSRLSRLACGSLSCTRSKMSQDAADLYTLNPEIIGGLTPSHWYLIGTVAWTTRVRAQ